MKQVLIVEDEPDILFTLKSRLSLQPLTASRPCRRSKKRNLTLFC